eukprot:TRINITY_DN19455_c0_g1_i1.p1 TRINITY_DN19455_c0_g1~~TRINITY_DN19455_c0_g1_i1.p1  ORF type:complete len:182 (+),score=25.95 TRINITY_DN19455_c0_g1_i1:129-674(+)
MVQHTLVMIGGGGVGKSSLTVQFLHNKFLKDYDPTIEESYRKQVVVDEKACVLVIVDTAGQEEFQALRDEHMGAGEGFVLVYSLTSRSSFDDAKSLRSRILRVTGKETVPIALIGNKFDLQDYREVPTNEGKALASSWSVPFLETSAKSRLNVDSAFYTVVREIRKSNGTYKQSGGCCVVM